MTMYVAKLVFHHQYGSLSKCCLQGILGIEGNILQFLDFIHKQTQ